MSEERNISSQMTSKLVCLRNAVPKEAGLISGVSLKKKKKKKEKKTHNHIQIMADTSILVPFNLHLSS